MTFIFDESYNLSSPTALACRRFFFVSLLQKSNSRAVPVTAPCAYESL